MAGLAGFAAAYRGASEIVLTDGNPLAVDSIHCRLI